MTLRLKFVLVFVCLLLICGAGIGSVTLINLAEQVTGILAKTNGGTGLSSTATFPSSGTVMVTTTGVVASQMPALTGDVTTSPGAVATALAHTYPLALGTATGPACTSGGGTSTFIGLGNSSTTENSVVQFVPTEAFTVSRLYVQINAAVPSGETAAVTVMDNTAGQTVTCSVAAAATTCNDTAHSFTTTAGHRIDVKLVCSGGTTALTAPVSIGLGLK